MSQASGKIVLFGCGAWGRNIARVLAELGVLTAICDSDTARGSNVARELDVEFVADGRAALASPHVDAVAIATPAATHAALALAALNAGKHVYVEKPIALTASDAQAMAAAAAKASRVLMVGHLLQYHPVFVRLLDMVGDGALGNIRYVYSNRLNMGRIRTEENALWSLAPHDISMVLAIAGQAPSHVHAAGLCAAQPDIEDLAVVDLSFPNRMKAHIFCSWLNPYKEHRLAVVGDAAMAVFDDTQPAWEDKLVLHHHKVVWKDGVPQFEKGPSERIHVSKGEPLRCEMQHFIDCAASGQRPKTDASEAIAVLDVLAAAQHSMEGGRS